MRSFDPSIHILIVEDDDVDIQDIQRTFKKNKIVNPLHFASNGLEAFDMLYGRNGVTKLTPTPKVIILDINMPKMNGIEFLKKLRADPDLKSMLVFILSSSNDERDIISAYDFNVAGYIVKPLQFDSFQQAIGILDLYWALIEFPKT